MPFELVSGGTVEIRNKVQTRHRWSIIKEGIQIQQASVHVPVKEVLLWARPDSTGLFALICPQPNMHRHPQTGGTLHGCELCLETPSPRCVSDWLGSESLTADTCSVWPGRRSWTMCKFFVRGVRSELDGYGWTRRYSGYDRAYADGLSLPSWIRCALVRLSHARWPIICCDVGMTFGVPLE